MPALVETRRERRHDALRTGVGRGWERHYGRRDDADAQRGWVSPCVGATRDRPHPGRWGVSHGGVASGNWTLCSTRRRSEGAPSSVERHYRSVNTRAKARLRPLTERLRQRANAPLRPATEAEPPLLPGGRVVRHRIAIGTECGRAQPDEPLGGRRARGAEDDRHALVDGLEVEERVVRQVGRDLRAERLTRCPAASGSRGRRCC